jgi:hypothetical protein
MAHLSGKDAVIYECDFCDEACDDYVGVIDHDGTLKSACLDCLVDKLDDAKLLCVKHCTYSRNMVREFGAGQCVQCKLGGKK